MSFTRRVEFYPAWDKRSTDPGKNYGVSGVRIYFALTGELGVVAWELNTPWYLPEVEQWHETLGLVRPFTNAVAGPLTFHSAERRNAEQGEASICFQTASPPSVYIRQTAPAAATSTEGSGQEPEK